MRRTSSSARWPSIGTQARHQATPFFACSSSSWDCGRPLGGGRQDGRAAIGGDGGHARGAAARSDRRAGSRYRDAGLHPRPSLFGDGATRGQGHRFAAGSAALRRAAARSRPSRCRARQLLPHGLGEQIALTAKPVVVLEVPIGGPGTRGRACRRSDPCNSRARSSSSARERLPEPARRSVRPALPEGL